MFYTLEAHWKIFELRLCYSFVQNGAPKPSQTSLLVLGWTHNLGPGALSGTFFFPCCDWECRNSSSLTHSSHRGLRVIWEHSISDESQKPRTKFKVKSRPPACSATVSRSAVCVCVCAVTLLHSLRHADDSSPWLFLLHGSTRIRLNQLTLQRVYKPLQPPPPPLPPPPLPPPPGSPLPASHNACCYRQDMTSQPRTWQMKRVEGKTQCRPSDQVD